MEPQFLHLIDGKLMVGEKKPTMWGYVDDPEDVNWLVCKQFDFDFTVWRESLVEVKNPEFFDSEENRGRTRYDGQQVQTSEPGRITKIL